MNNKEILLDKCLISNDEFLTSFKTNLLSSIRSIEDIMFDIHIDINILFNILSNDDAIYDMDVLKEIQYLYHNKLMKLFETISIDISNDEKYIYLDNKHKEEKNN